MNPFFQIDIPKRHSHCIKGGERLEPGMEYYSLLIENCEEEKMLRHDFCSICWHMGHANDYLPSSRGHWQSRIEETIIQEKGPQPRLTRALDLIKELLQEAKEEKTAEIYLLALFLARSKKLFLRQEFEKEQDHYQLYEIANEDEFLTVRKIDLSLINVKTVQESISSKLAYEKRT